MLPSRVVVVLHALAAAARSPQLLDGELVIVDGVDRLRTIRLGAAAVPRPVRGRSSSELAGVELAYQAPVETPRGVFLVLHGCHHRATDAWPRSPGCPACLGLPVETRIVGAALTRGWAVAAVTSLARTENQNPGCWHKKDLPRLKRAIAWVRRATGAGPATVAFGASSGGAIAVCVPGVDAAVAQVMPSPRDLNRRHPPVRFVPMVRDASRLKIVRDQVQTLRRARVDAAALVATPEPLNETALYRRGPGPGGEVLPTRADAAAVVAALRRGGFLDDQGYLLEDPRRSDWRSVVRPVVTTDSLVAHASPISEILNVAWAEHEYTDAFLDETLDWLDAKASTRRPT